MNGQTHTVRRAVIMAAGIGKRLRPLTLETPKPLVTVNGKRMIDTVVEGLHENGIREIYVVVGHLKEQFREWAAHWEGVTLIDNPYYDTCNNIASLYVAREHIDDCIILDGDQIIYDPSVLEPRFERSGYNAVWTEEETDEWLMDVEDGIVRGCSRTGGSRGWRLYSISRWTREDGEKLRELLRREFEGGNTQIYWDDVAMFCHFGAFRLGIREMRPDAVVEIDNLEELVRYDGSYRYLLDTDETQELSRKRQKG